MKKKITKPSSVVHMQKNKEFFFYDKVQFF